jgi:phage virion morphogenesis protein
VPKTYFYAAVESAGVQRMLGDYISRLKPARVRSLMGEYGGMMRKSIMQNFSEGGRPDKWPPLSRPRKRKDGRLATVQTPLIGTGKMKGSVRWRVWEGGTAVKIGTRFPVAWYHQYGTGHVPKRQFIMFQRDDLKEINTRAWAFIMRTPVQGPLGLRL